MTRPSPHDLKLLGLTQAATLADLNRAFRARARTLHPDRGGDPRAFQELNNAHQRLKEALARSVLVHDHHPLRYTMRNN